VVTVPEELNEVVEETRVNEEMSEVKETKVDDELRLATQMTKTSPYNLSSGR
jgi:hypothetical protein